MGKAMLLWAGSGRGFRTVRTEIELPRLRDVAVGPADSNVRCVAASTASAPITDDRFLVTLIIVRSFRMARPSLLLALRAAADEPIAASAASSTSGPGDVSSRKARPAPRQYSRARDTLPVAAVAGLGAAVAELPALPGSASGGTTAALAVGWAAIWTQEASNLCTTVKTGAATGRV